MPWKVGQLVLISLFDDRLGMFTHFGVCSTIGCERVMEDEAIPVSEYASIAR